jgi:hypothetical protein
MRRDRLRVLQGPAVRQVRRDPRRPKCVTAGRRRRVIMARASRGRYSERAGPSDRPPRRPRGSTEGLHERSQGLPRDSHKERQPGGQGGLRPAPERRSSARPAAIPSTVEMLPLLPGGFRCAAAEVDFGEQAFHENVCVEERCLEQRPGAACDSYPPGLDRA